MFFYLSKVLSFLINPLLWVVALLFFAFYVNNKKYKRFFFATGLLLLIIVSNPFIINQVLQAYEMEGYSDKQIVRPYDVCIVMGGSVRYYNGQTVSPVFGNGVDRLMQAVALYKAGKIKRILLSGGSGYVTLQHVKEADLLKPLLINFGIPDSAILIENQSRNTYENAYMSKQTLAEIPQINSILIITSAYHVVRTKACFDKLNIKADYYPVDALSGQLRLTPDKIFIPNADAINNWVTLLHEWLGLITYKMAGYC